MSGMTEVGASRPYAYQIHSMSIPKKWKKTRIVTNISIAAGADDACEVDDDANASDVFKCFSVTCV
jgi:hypothetical protein